MTPPFHAAAEQHIVLPVVLRIADCRAVRGVERKERARGLRLGEHALQCVRLALCAIICAVCVRGAPGFVECAAPCVERRAPCGDEVDGFAAVGVLRVRDLCAGDRHERLTEMLSAPLRSESPTHAEPSSASALGEREIAHSVSLYGKYAAR